jgi:Flp pilus assembly protein TadG
MNCTVRGRRGQRCGVALVILTLAILVIGPMVGLAIDVGILYLLKARLSQAADAACLAGARSLARGADIDSQRANAISVSQRYFDANFPDGYWASRNRTRAVTVDETQLKLRIITLTASVQAPLYFLQFLNHQWANLNVTAQARRRDINVMMVLDRSGSMQNAGACSALRSSATAFVDKFANGRDRVGMLSFNGASQLDYALSLTFKDSPSVYTKISAITCGGWTGTAQALWLAYQELVRINEPGALNMLLFFTDGRPTALTATFPIRTVSDKRYGDGSGSYGSTSQLYTMTKSPCSSTSPKTGFVAANGFDATGPTYGLYQYNRNNSTEAYITSNSGCAFAQDQDGDYVRRDVAYIPTTDYFGNATINTGYKTVPVFPSGSGYVYPGQIRPDTPQGVRYAAYNAADNAVTRIRSDTTLNVVTYVIGLGGTGSGVESPDTELMLRISNAGNPPLDPNRPVGLYVYAPDSTQLTNAFLQVASQILRLAE